jgi:hypothetical protein
MNWARQPTNTHRSTRLHLNKRSRDVRLPIMKTILSGVLASEILTVRIGSARALPIEFIELSRMNYGV